MKPGLKWVLISLVPIAGLAWWAGPSLRPAHAADPAPPSLVPVTTEPTRLQDVPVYLNGLGTVQALNVVEIKAQVNGILIGLPAREGQEVHKGDIVAEIDPRPYQAALDQAMAQKKEDEATLQGAQLDLKRYQSLARSQFAPVQQVDDQQATVSKQTAAIAADAAAIETAQINLSNCVIQAPFDGRVSLYQVDVGNLIEVGTQTGIISITQDHPISVVFTLPEADLVHVQDARGRGTVPVIVTNTDDSSELAKGVLTTPNNTIDTSTGTISLKAVFDNGDNHLWPGQFVNARVEVDVLHHVATVPMLALEHGPDGLFVYLVNPDHTVTPKAVQVGYQDNGRAVVTAGLSGNETIVVTGQSRLAPGVRVNPTDTSKASASASQQPSAG